MNKTWFHYWCHSCEAEWGSQLLYEKCYLCESQDLAVEHEGKQPRQLPLVDLSKKRSS
jgi:hypothetical protein